MTFQRLLPLLLIVTISGPVYAASSPSTGSVTAPTQDVQQILGDEQTMALILALQSDPEMQALLNDPAVLSAVQSGDLNALTTNPKFLKLLENQKVKEIQKRVVE